jgi:hypothetical protein
MNFLDAKRVVSPDKPVVPGSKEHLDILKMMRESGKVFPEDNVPVVPIPLVKPASGIARQYVNIQSKPVGKKPGILTGAKVAVASAPAPTACPYYFVAGGKGKSKLECKKFKILPIIIEDGTHERGAEVQTTCTAEGGTGESKSST